MAETMRCYRHPNRETRVSCATCGRPICTECMVPTDVGIKCPDDARLPRGARAGAMKRDQILKSILAGVAVAVAGFFVAYAIFQAGGRNGGPLAVAVSVVATAIPFLVALAPSFLSGSTNVLAVVPMIFATVTAGLANRRL